MASKPLIEYLARYTPEGISRDILASAGEYKCRVNKEGKMLQITAHFPRVYRKSDIRLLESEIRKAYELNYVHIITHYGKELFSSNYMDEMLQELQVLLRACCRNLREPIPSWSVQEQRIITFSSSFLTLL